MSTGLRIDQPFSFKSWRIPFRLVTITMILNIAIVMGLAYFIFEIDLASALLFGAVLAPTDPVLASDVQVGPPLEKSHDNTRFTLTAEAGMNDGMAFPFTWLAVACSLYIQNGEYNFAEWFWRDVIYKVAVGVAAGFGLGKLVAFFLFSVPSKRKVRITQDGFVAICATLFVYGITELLKGYGFIAVFVAAVTIRNFELHHTYHKKLHEFTDQIERIILAIVLLLLGGNLVKGIIPSMSWQLAVFAIVVVFLIRPLTALAALIGAKLHAKEKLAISFYGIKGIGSFFYLAFALEQTSFSFPRTLWAGVCLVVILSIVVHGFTASWIMKRLSNQFSYKTSTPGEEKNE